MTWRICPKTIDPKEDGLQCPYCDGIYPKDCFRWVKKGTANNKVNGVAPRPPGSVMAEKLQEPDEEPEPGRLNGIAAKVLMKLFYAARLARFDLLRAIANLARYITKWTAEHDRRLHKLMCYVKSTLDYRQVGYVGDSVSQVNLHLYADANFGGSRGKSTTGVQLHVEGPHTRFPIEAASAAQSCVSHSTPEAEIIAGSHAVRKVRIPALVM